MNAKPGTSSTLMGAGIQSTFLNIQSLTNTGIEVLPSATTPPTAVDQPTITIANMSIWRTNLSNQPPYPPNPPPAATAEGIKAGNNYTYYFYNLFLRYHNNGFDLGSSNASYILNCEVANCTNHGFAFANDSTAPQLQWMLFNTLSLYNLKCGYIVVASSFQSQKISPYITMSPWINAASFGNNLYGFSVSATKSGGVIYGIQDFSLLGGYSAADQLGGILLNTFGQGHRISDSVFELAGQPTGASFGVGLLGTGVGNGITLQDNLNVTITNTRLLQNSYNGMLIDNVNLVIPGTTTPTIGEVTITGCRIADNNYYQRNPPSGPVRNDIYDGVRITSNTSCTIAGSRIGSQFFVSQDYAVNGYDGQYLTISGCDLRSVPNTNFPPIQAVANPYAIRTIANLGWASRTNGISPNITAGSTSTTFPHSLSLMNVAGYSPISISITPNPSIPGKTGVYTYFTYTDTTITITLSSPLAFDINFHWSATTTFFD